MVTGGHVGWPGARGQVHPYTEPRRMTPPHALAPSCSSSSSMAPPPPPHKSLESTPPQQPAVLAAESAAVRFAVERCMAAKSGWVPPLSPPLSPPCGEVLHMLITRPREPTARGESLWSTCMHSMHACMLCYAHAPVCMHVYSMYARVQHVCTCAACMQAPVPSLGPGNLRVTIPGRTGLRLGVTLTRVDEPNPTLLLPGTYGEGEVEG